MDKNKKFLIRVDEYNRWTHDKYREVTADELDKIIDGFGRSILSIVSHGTRGAMTMWACFLNCIQGGCYGDVINAYRIMSDDPVSLVNHEHELRHLWQQYQELHAIRYYGSLEAYYLEKAKRAKETFDKYAPKEEIR